MPARVVILGGGAAGMSAAHELVERGFEVVVLERRYVPGGKARSVHVTHESGHQLAHLAKGRATIGHRLPGEHGFRFFPGFYKHVIDTMRRIPSFDGRPVADHLVPTTRMGVTQYRRPTFVVPMVFPRTPSNAGVLLRDILATFGPIADLTPEELAFFGARLWQILTSSAERRLAEYERINWWEFVSAEERSKAYQKFLAIGLTRSLVASKARRASTRTIGDIFVQLMLTVLNPTGGSTDRVLDGPTNLVWIDPWLAYLRSRGVQYDTKSEIEEILCHKGRISSVAVNQGGKRTVMQGDHYIAALPLERIAPLVNRALLAAAPELANLAMLAPNVEWMRGVQFYLHRDVPTAHGHVIHIDTGRSPASRSCSSGATCRRNSSAIPMCAALYRSMYPTGRRRVAMGVPPCTVRAKRSCAKHGGSSRPQSMLTRNCCATRICIRGSSTRISTSIQRALALYET